MYKVSAGRNGRKMEKTFKARRKAIEHYQSLYFLMFGSIPTISDCAIVSGISGPNWWIQFEEIAE